MLTYKNFNLTKSSYLVKYPLEKLFLKVSLQNISLSPFYIFYSQLIIFFFQYNYFKSL